MLKDRPNPYEKEIDTCDHLIAFCNRLKIQHGLAEAPSSDDIKSTQKEFLKQSNAEDVNKKVQEGKLERAKTKVEKEQEQMIQIGGKKKGKGKKVKKDTQVEEAFNIDFSVINKFAFLKVNVPLGPEDLDDKIKELSEKREKYIADGEQRLKEEEEKLGDPEAAFDDFKEEEREREEFDRPRGERGGRGGFRGSGRGGRGVRGGFRGGRGGFRDNEGGERRQRRERDEFEHDEDEEYEQPKKTVSRRTYKKEDLNVDESSYPTL
jgi:hypothetical protein